MDATESWAPARRDEFHQKFSELMGSFPEFQKMTPCECGEVHMPDEFNPDDPRVLMGYCLVLNFENIHGFGELVWVTPPGQNPYYTMGMTNHAYNMM